MRPGEASSKMLEHIYQTARRRILGYHNLKTALRPPNRHWQQQACYPARDIFSGSMAAGA